MGWTLRDKDLKEILLAVDLGHDLNLVGQEYVKAFNNAQGGRYRILDWEIKEPGKNEIDLALLKKFNSVASFQWVVDHWETVYKPRTGNEVRKRLFFIILKKVIEDPIKKVAPDKAAEAVRQNFKRTLKSGDDGNQK